MGRLSITQKLFVEAPPGVAVLGEARIKQIGLCFQGVCGFKRHIYK